MRGALSPFAQGTKEDYARGRHAGSVLDCRDDGDRCNIMNLERVRAACVAKGIEGTFQANFGLAVIVSAIAAVVAP